MSASSRAEMKSYCGRPMNFCGPLAISSRWHETKMWEWSGCSCRKQANGFKNSSSSQLVPILLFSLRAIPDIYSTIVLACHILCSLRVHRFNLHSLSNRKSRGFFLTPFIDSTFLVSIIFKFENFTPRFTTSFETTINKPFNTFDSISGVNGKTVKRGINCGKRQRKMVDNINDMLHTTMKIVASASLIFRNR